MAPTPEDSDDESKLELPSLSIFRWRKKDSGAEEPSVESASEPSTDADSAAGSPLETPEPRAELGSEADEPDLEEPGAPEPEPEAAAEASSPEPEPSVEETQPLQPVESAAETPVETEAPPVAAAEEAPAVQPEPGAAPEPEAEFGTMFPNAVDDSGDAGDAGDEPTQVLPAADSEDGASSRSQIDQFGEDESAYATPGDAGVPLEKRRERKPLTLPALTPTIAAPLTGVVVGLVGVALTFITQRGCEAVKGTGSCGGVGLFFLIAILALMVLFGAALLKAWQISDPTSSSFLAVGLVAVLAMLFFLPEIDTWYMVIVIPVLTALTYLLSWWVTHTFIESADDA